MKKIFWFFILAAAVMPVFCRAQITNKGDVVINEIAWMGSTNSASDEWLELKNTTDAQIDFSGWILQSMDGKIKISLAKFIGPHDFYLLERTDDNSVPGVAADLIYKGSLSNTGQNLLLQDSFGNTIDQVNVSTKWPAGNNTTKQTMEKTLADWQTSQNPNGTPRAENSTGDTKTINPSKITGTATDAASPSPTPDITYPEGIIINEILPSPEGADETNEWIEVYNTNNVIVDISGWKLQDTQGTSATYVFPKNTNLTAYDYLVLKRPDTNIILNNDQDGLNLILPSGKITDSVSYSKAPINQSYNHTASTWQWSTTLTPGAKNKITANPPEKTSTKLPKTKKTDSKYVSAISKATDLFASPTFDITNQENNNALNPWWLFLGAGGIIIILAATILTIKFKLYTYFLKNKP